MSNFGYQVLGFGTNANPSGGASTGGTLFTTTGNHSYTIPAGVTTIHAVVIGAGGGGGGTSGAAAGAGGALAYTNNISVTPGQTIYVQVGAGGQWGGPSFGGQTGQTASAGGVSWVNVRFC